MLTREEETRSSQKVADRPVDSTAWANLVARVHEAAPPSSPRGSMTVSSFKQVVRRLVDSCRRKHQQRADYISYHTRRNP
jgi:hypothetical protein